VPKRLVAAQRSAADRAVLRGWLWAVAAAALLLAVVALWFVVVYSRDERQEEQDRWIELLSLQARTQASLLETLIADKLVHTRLAAAVAAGAEPASGVVPANSSDRQLESVLRLVATEAGFTRLDLLDALGRRLTGSDGPEAPVVDRALLERVGASGSPVVDLLPGGESGDCNVVLAVPASRPGAGASVIVAQARWSSLRSTLAIHADRPHGSAEVVLFRRRGDRIEFLSPLRLRPADCARFSLPLSTPDLAASDVVARGHAAGRYADYEGHAVLAAGLLLKSVDWGLVAKIDRDEAMAAVDSRLRWQARTGGATLISLLLATAGLAESRRRAARDRESRARRQAEAELLKLSRAVVQSPVSVVITDTSGAIEYVNPKFETLTGYSMAEVRGKNPRILQSGVTPAATYREMWANLAAGREWRGELCNRKKDGSLYWESASISPIVDAAGRTTHYLAVKEDITARRDLELQLQRSQRLEAIGRLAGGIAHDFNNLLTVIDGFTELVLADLPADAAHRGDLLEVRAASGRAARLTRQLLAFGRRRPEARQPVVLAELLPSLMRMLERLLGEDVALDFRVAPDLPPVLADPGGLEQIVVNLAVNARDAMPAGGRIAIEAGRASLDGEEALRLGLEGAGEHVRLTVSDTGPGVPPEIRDRIFEPFFTTKEVGKGTGLGLSVVFGLVGQFHGSIELESPESGGARFVLHFPPTRETGVTPADAAATPDPRGRETILWVEDDPAVRELTRRMLTSAGYRVLVAAGPEAALALPAFDLAAASLLITDVRMPGMSGPELARRLRERHPGLPVLFVSGDSGAAALDAQIPHEDVLPKPFDLHTLLARVRQALDSGHRA
jgi:PAS domain S-box-containing protein